MTDAEIKAWLGDFKPLLTMRYQQFQAMCPPHIRMSNSYCWTCSLAFNSLEECITHVREKHQLQGGR